MEYYFTASQMSVGYNNCPIIKNIELCLEKGEILTLIGPNGAGKSTILKSIAKQLELIDGVVYIGKNELNKISSLELSQTMAVVFTEKLKTEMMTCEEVVATGRYPYTGYFGVLSKKDYNIIEEAMKLVHIKEIKDKDFTKISDGQRQRVMLARAICQEPEIIILDEPTSFLDIKYKLELLSTLQKLRKEKGLTVIMSLHELELAAKVSDKILCINGKYVDRFGKSDEVFVSGYISDLFNISSGSYDEESGDMELEAVKGKAEIFVVAGDGTGRKVYRQLQRQGLPFTAGILYRNDLDYPIAKALATEIIEAESFEPITDEVLKIAKNKLRDCKKVICCRKNFGSIEHANNELLDFARQSGKAIEVIEA